MSDITVGAIEVVGFNANNIGVDVALTGVTVTLDSDQVTGSSFLPARVVGMGGFQIDLGTPAVNYDVESIESRSALTLTTNYLAGSGTVTGTLYKWVELRIYALNSFTPSGSSEPIQQGAPHSSQWFRRYAASIVNDGVQNVLHVPQIVLPATTDSSNPTARYFAGLYAPAGNFLQAFPSNSSGFQLDADTTPTSWAQIIAFNTPSPPHPSGVSMDSFYTKAEIDARFPSGLQNQLIYFAATGNVFTPLDLSSDFTIVADELQLSSTSGYDRIQEEGANLAQQNTLNFIGSSFTAADDAGNSRTNVTADSDLNAIASNATNGLYARTGDGTVSARTITGTTNLIDVTNGDGVAGNPTITVGADVAVVSDTLAVFAATTSAQLAGVISDETGSGALVFGTSPTIATPTVSGGGFTSPRVITAINDTNNNELIRVTATASAVNDITVANAATAGSPSISATGDDAAVGLGVATKSTGNFTVTTNSIPRITVAGADANLYLGDGVTSASPDTYVINATGGSGTDIAGANLDLAGGKGTGTGEPGFVAVRYPLRVATGTTLQALSAERFPVSTALYTNATIGTAYANSTTETSLFNGITASDGSTLTLEAGFTKDGTVYRLIFDGDIGTTGTPTMRFRLKLGAIDINDTTALTMPNNANGRILLEYYVYVIAIGAAGSVRGNLRGEITSAQNGIVTLTHIVRVDAPTIDFTASNLIAATAQWGTASASNTLQITGICIERIR